MPQNWYTGTMSEGQYVKFLVRFPAELLAALRVAARENDRTLTGEIIHRLRLSLRATDRRDSR